LCTYPFHGRRNIFDFLTLGKQPKKSHPAKALEAKEEAKEVRHLAT
jgi:hypothetical protein